MIVKRCGRGLIELVPLVLLCGGLSSSCVRWGFGSRTDASSGADDLPPLVSNLDASPADSKPTSRCSWRDAFTLSAPQPLSELNSPGTEGEPFLTADGLTIYFAYNRQDGATSYSWTATRSTRDEPFGTPQRVFDDPAGEGHLSLTADGRTAFVAARWAGGQGKADIWWARRDSATDPLRQVDFVALTAVNTPDNEFDPFPSADGLRLYFNAWHGSPPDNHAKVYIARRASGAASFGAPELVPGVGTLPGDQDNPVVTADELVMLFGMHVDGPSQVDVWYALRDAQTGEFVSMGAVPVINAPQAQDHQLYISPDGCEVIFASSRSGMGDLFITRYLPVP